MTTCPSSAIPGSQHSAQLRITEIYKSIQGEAVAAGKPCTFIRTTGCPLRCRWCDTAYGFSGGSTRSLSGILEEVKNLACPRVELTGGEPLSQVATPQLMHLLIDAGYEVLLETGGSESIAAVPKQVHIIMDLKCPDSGMSGRNCYPNLQLLKPSDEIKFVVAGRSDFDWALQTIAEHQINPKQVLISPAWGLVAPQHVSAWILDAGCDVKLNLQLHKYIWHPAKRGV